MATSTTKKDGRSHPDNANAGSNANGSQAIAVMRFDDRNRYGVKGIPSSILFGDNSRTWVVNCKRPTKKNCWAKVKIIDSVNRIAELVDILGHVGDYATELNALQLYFHVLPCRYPKTKEPSEDGRQGLSTSTTGDTDGSVEDCTSLKVFSVDDISTLDVDDALSLQTISSSNFTLGIHVANVARKISTTSELFQWAQVRGASAYSGGVQGVAEGDNKSNKSTAASSASVPMLPPKLAHDELSLLQDQPRHALTLWLTVEKDGEGKFQITSKRHSQTLVINRQKTTYEHWNTVTSKEDPYLVECRQIIQALALQSGDTNNPADDVSAEDLVAWTMVQYNAYFGELLAHKCDDSVNHTRGLLRAQRDVEKSAEYVYASQNPTAMHHASLHLDYYAHCSSPIRRFCDLWNQHVLLSRDAKRKDATTMQLDLPRYNDRCAELKRYHATVDTMELAYTCRQKARVFTGRVEISGSDDDYGGKSLLVYTPKRRVRVPLKDSYFAEPIVDAIEQATKDKDGNVHVTISIELCGVLVAGRTRLRGRLVGVNSAAMNHMTSVMASPPHVQHGGDMDASSIVRLGADVIGKKESPHGSSPATVPPPGLAAPPTLAPPPGIAAPPGLAPPPGIAAPPGLTKSPAQAEAPVPAPHPQEINDNNNTIGNIENSNSDELDEDGNIDLDEVTQKQKKHLPEAAQAWINNHNEMLKLQANSPANIDLMEACKLNESTVNQVLGYNIDEFQQRCLDVIVNPDQDLMAMAPTGSGKTAVALMAILQSFARNKRAFYTSPIKALSNQKYSEFTEWFAGRGIDAHVTLLTGDVKIRAPPGATNELIICTSEILRNKLIKASGGDHGSTSYIANAAREAASKGDQAAQQALDIMIREGYISETQDNQDKGDPDLERLGCVVSDEIHYINDVERGVVWEETLMHLPKDVQSVALSATLRHPEKFVEWIESVRSRTGKLVIRTDRHVPLHVGGLDPKRNDLLEFYGTHKDVVANRSAGEFDHQIFHQLFSRKALENKNSISADTTRMAQKEVARGGRDAELQAQRDAFAGGGGRGGGSSGGRGGGRGGGGGRGRGGSSASNSNNKGPPKVNFGHECIQLASSLDKVDKLPGIVFCMSRRMCVQGAHACKSLNLLLGKKGPKKPSEEEGIFALQQWEAEEHIRQTKVRTIERKRAQMHRQHLQKFMQEPYNLGDLEAYRDIEQLLSRGVAYHHGGMLPILREYVELCFQQRLVRLVFATETLAVGVNMPARTVVFSQVDKPDENSSGGAGGMAHRWLRVDEFWQMAGRAGRRGLDVVGYVLYAPTLSVAGLKNIAPVHEFNRMLVGQVAPATSQLVVDRPFVLRHLLRGHGVSILSKTLKSDEMRRQNIVALERFSLEQNSALSAKAEEQMKGFERFDEIEATVSGKGGIGGLKIKLSQKQQKKLMAEQRAIINEYPGGMVAFRAAKTKAGEAQKTLQEIETKESLLKSTWNRHLDWLIMAGFVKDDGKNTLTPRGTCAAAFSDGEPLIMGTVIADGGLKKLNIKEICAWICLFIPYRASGDYPALPENPVSPSENLLETVEYSDSLAQQLGREDPLERTLMYLMLDWLTHKDLTRIAMITDPHLLGGFVKAVMRVLSYGDMIRQVLLGLGDYETHNTLDHHADALLGGLVTNESLYLHMH